jgi:hypothetical protein
MRRPLTAHILTADGYLGAAVKDAAGADVYPKAAVRLVVIPQGAKTLQLRDGGAAGTIKFEIASGANHPFVVSFAPDFLSFDTDCYVNITGAGTYCIYTG